MKYFLSFLFWANLLLAPANAILFITESSSSYLGMAILNGFAVGLLGDKAIPTRDET